MQLLWKSLQRARCVECLTLFRCKIIISHFHGVKKSVGCKKNVGVTDDPQAKSILIFHQKKFIQHLKESIRQSKLSLFRFWRDSQFTVNQNTTTDSLKVNPHANYSSIQSCQVLSSNVAGGIVKNQNLLQKGVLYITSV